MVACVWQALNLLIYGQFKSFLSLNLVKHNKQPKDAKLPHVNTSENQWRFHAYTIRRSANEERGEFSSIGINFNGYIFCSSTEFN